MIKHLAIIAATSLAVSAIKITDLDFNLAELKVKSEYP